MAPRFVLIGSLKTSLGAKWAENAATDVSTITVPPGTRIDVGYAGKQGVAGGGSLYGGGSQVYIPDVDPAWLKSASGASTTWSACELIGSNHMADGERTIRLRDLASRYFPQGHVFLLKLPDGWLGRPFDNLYWVNSVEWRGGSLEINTTRDHRLFISDVTDIRETNEGIEIVSDGPVSFEWTERSQGGRRRQLSPSGTVTLVTPVPAG